MGMGNIYPNMKMSDIIQNGCGEGPFKLLSYVTGMDFNNLSIDDVMEEQCYIFEQIRIHKN